MTGDRGFGTAVGETTDGVRPGTAAPPSPRPDGTGARRGCGCGGQEGSPTSSQDLLLYDVKQRRTVLVATAVGMVLCRAGVLWWSTGDNEALAWHVLDLRTLR